MTDSAVQLTPDMIGVLAILAFAIFLFVSDIVRVDVAAILVMVILGLTSLIPDHPGLVPASKLFDGFSSNAVVSIIAVMILGAGLDKTGALNRLAAHILKIAGNTERRVSLLLSGTVGVISGFMQNIGAAALFLPVADRISKRTSVSPTRLLMPLGYCAILGGTVTMVGSSPLILLNDLITFSNPQLPPHIAQLETFSMFSVTPIGIVLLICGMVYFYFFGHRVLPVGTVKSLETGAVASYVQDIYGISGQIYELTVGSDSTMVGRSIGDIEDESGYEERIIAINTDGKIVVEPSRDTVIRENCDIAMMGRYEQIAENAKKYKLEMKNEIRVFQEAFNPSVSGIAEVVIPPSSTALGKTMGDLGFRRNFGVTLLAIYRNEKPIRENLFHVAFRAGDTLIVHSLWRDLQRFVKSLEFVAVTDFPREDFRPNKFYIALAIFLATLGLVLFSSLKLSAALLTGATLMIIAGVIKIEEAYRAIGWQSIFLLASLIPLGFAVENSGTALWIAQQFVLLVQGVPVLLVLAALGLLTTVFTLIMSNVGATVLLVPIAINIAAQVHANPSVFALTVALATSNSFLIPTHQVNALIQAPGGYRVIDFMKAGSFMTAMFLTIVILMVHFLFGI